MAHLADGRVAFASGAIPGDVIQPAAIEAGKGHVRATRWTLVTASPDRVEPPCAVADRCGGCDWMTLARPAQLLQKAGVLSGALSRIGHLHPSSDLKVTVNAPSNDLGYRSRVRFQIDAGGAVGFFARGTHDLVAIPECIVCRPELNQALTALRRLSRDVLCSFSAVDVRCSEVNPQVSLHFTPRVHDATAHAKRTLRAKLPSAWTVSVALEPDEDDEAQSFELSPGVRLRAAPGVFTQVNWPVNVALVEAVVRGARERGALRFLDCYAGAGNFSLPLIAAGMTGVSVDSDERAIASAKEQATLLGHDAEGFVTDDAARLTATLARDKARFDLILLDPPRSGAKEVLDSVARLAPAFIAYCSCDPVTLARDVATLGRAGYELSDVSGFDMFPHTHHFESLAWLRRKEPAQVR
jgi:23S rRNA (uracil1939-C5)-methyltransferase